jgi:hypothetical protein
MSTQQTPSPPPTPLPSEAPDDAATSAVGSLSEDALETLAERVRDVIDAREQGIRYAESRLNAYVVLSGGFVATALAVTSLGLSVSNMRVRIVALSFALAIAALAIALLTILVRSTNPPYPFIDKRLDLKQNRWKWFYWDALPSPQDFAKMSIWGRQSSKAHDAEVTATSTQFPSFVGRMVDGLPNDKVNAAEDLRQLYTLHINERFKNQYLTNARKVLRGGMYCVLVATLAGAIISFAVQPNTEVKGHTVSAREEVLFDYGWHELSDGGADATAISLTMKVRNASDDRVVFRQLVALDERGYDLPAYTEDFTITVPPGKTREVTLRVIVPNSYAGAIATWTLR